MNLKRRLKTLRAWVVIGTVVVLAIGTALITAAYQGWGVGTGDHDKGVTVTVAATIAAGVLGAVALVLALFAYLSASGTPDLSIEIQFSFSEVNEPVFKVGAPREQDRCRPIEHFKQNRATVMLQNTSRYAARNPWVWIKLNRISLSAVPDGWKNTRPASMDGVTEFVWEGDIVHGEMPLLLPGIVLADSYIIPGRLPSIDVTVVADGIRPRTETLRVKVLNAEEYEGYIADRRAAYEFMRDRDRLLRGPFP
jgi:hypothetical protein